MCEIGGSGNLKTISGAEASVSFAPIDLGYRKAITGSRYEKTLGATFQICKDPERFDEYGMEVQPEEFRSLSRWLGRRKFLWFHPIDEENTVRQTPWFRAYFSLKKIDAGGRTIGVELDMTTDSPFGYGEEIEETYIFSADKLTQVIYDKNDEVGNIWPEMDVICGQDGELRLANRMTGCLFRMRNCSSGEIISQSGDTKIISSGMQYDNLLSLPGGADYEAGKTTLHNGWLYTVDSDGSITVTRASEGVSEG